MEGAVFGALAKEPHARFVSVQDFVDVLEEVQDATQPLLLSPSSAPMSPEQPDQDPSAATAQILVLTRRQTADREEQAAMLQLEGTLRSQTNRERLLRMVRTFWIAGS